MCFQCVDMLKGPRFMLRISVFIQINWESRRQFSKPDISLKRCLFNDMCLDVTQHWHLSNVLQTWITFKWLNCATSPILYCLWSTTHGILNMHCITEISVLIGTYFIIGTLSREKNSLLLSSVFTCSEGLSTAKNMYCLLGKHKHVMWQPACLSFTFDANNLCASMYISLGRNCQCINHPIIKTSHLSKQWDSWILPRPTVLPFLVCIKCFEIQCIKE